MSCQATKTDSYEVVVNFPLSLTARCRLFLRNCLQRCLQFLRYACCVLIVLNLFLMAWVWFLIMVRIHCHLKPMLALEDLSIRSMTVYPNSTVADQWHGKSDFNVTLSAWNKNTVAGCFCTYRRMVVRVAFHDELFLQQEVPLGFGLKPRRSRPVVVQLKGDHSPMTKELGQLLDAELRNASSVNLQMYFDTRVMRNDRKAKWIHMRCQVDARTPRNTSEVSGNLLWKSCAPN